MTRQDCLTKFNNNNNNRKEITSFILDDRDIWLRYV